MASRIVGSLKSLCTNNVALLLCDMQDRFSSHIFAFDKITDNCNRAIDSCKLLNIPLIATEQYPRGLGHTVPQIHLNDIVPVEKTRFSMKVPGVTKLIHKDITNLIIIGIESHVCVLQSTLDFLDDGYTVHLPIDAISSRSQIDRTFGFKRAKQAGALLTTTESLIFQLCKDAQHPQFKQIQSFFRKLITID
ncbi:hypothetical protein GJ496_002871 [Pomphorhynchus laevis]|nr:hypothetical protein GJ496_002871 [Pomphorhynchus laevis]